MAGDDQMVRQLDELARLLENNGYAVEVDYTGATITVWAEVWPIELRLLKSVKYLRPSPPVEGEEDQ